MTFAHSFTNSTASENIGTLKPMICFPDIGWFEKMLSAWSIASTYTFPSIT